jgi:hypothetical protein
MSLPSPCNNDARLAQASALFAWACPRDILRLVTAPVKAVPLRPPNGPAPQSPRVVAGFLAQSLALPLGFFIPPPFLPAQRTDLKAWFSCVRGRPAISM